MVFSLKKDNHFYSLIAFSFGSVLLLYFALNLNIGIGIPDETFFLTIPQRLVQGDKLLTDEWHLSQLSYIFNYLLYHLFITLKGNTEGILLYFRAIFVVFDISYYVFLYHKLKGHNLAGILAAFLFCAIIPQTIFAFYYFTIATAAVLFFCLMLISPDNKTSIPGLLLAGAGLAIAISAEPLLIFLYFIYFFFAIGSFVLRKKGTISLLYNKITLKSFLFVSIGAFSVFLLFLGFLICFGGPIDTIAKIFPFYFSGKEYNSVSLLDPNRLFILTAFVSPLFIVGEAICLIGAIVIRCMQQKISEKTFLFFRWLIFFLSVVLLTGSLVRICINYYKDSNNNAFLVFHAVPMIFTSFVWMSLIKKPSPSLVLLCFTGLIFSCLTDFSSETAMGSGGRITQISGLIFFGNLLNEVRKTKAPPQKKTVYKRTFSKKIANNVILYVLLAAFSLYNFIYIYNEGYHKLYENFFLNHSRSDIIFLIERGPYAGLRTTEDLYKQYNSVLDDMDEIKKSIPEKARFFSFSKLVPYAYLYLDHSYGSYSAWYEDEINRLFSYWDILPDNRPDVVYIPTFSIYLHNEVFSSNPSAILHQLEMQTYISSMNIRQGEAGLIVFLDYETDS